MKKTFVLPVFVQHHHSLRRPVFHPVDSFWRSMHLSYRWERHRNWTERRLLGTWWMKRGIGPNPFRFCCISGLVLQKLIFSLDSETLTVFGIKYDPEPSIVNSMWFLFLKWEFFLYSDNSKEESTGQQSL